LEHVNRFTNLRREQREGKGRQHESEYEFHRSLPPLGHRF
jgi:hypothetical protein